MRKSDTMKAILASIERKKAEIAKLHAQVEALQEVYNQEAGIEPEPQTAKRRAPRANVKSTVLNLLERAGASGLNAHIACEMAKEDGVSLAPKSVSSLLSRLKHDGVVYYTGKVYILPQHAPGSGDTSEDTDQHAVVRPLRASHHAS